MKAVLWRLENRLGVTGRAAPRRRWRQIKRLSHRFSTVLLSADARLLPDNESTFEPNKRTGSRVQLKEGETSLGKKKKKRRYRFRHLLAQKKKSSTATLAKV